MITVKALKAFSDGELSMHDGEIRDIDETKATQYIAEGYVIEYTVPIIPSGKKSITDTSETDVAEYATAQVIDADLVAENIKKDVNILGVVGTYEGGGGGETYTIRQVNVNNTREEDMYALYPSYVIDSGEKVFTIKQAAPSPSGQASLAGCVTTNNKIYLYFESDNGTDNFNISVSNAASYVVSAVSAGEIFTKKVLITFADSVPVVTLS